MTSRTAVENPPGSRGRKSPVPAPPPSPGKRPGFSASANLELLIDKRVGEVRNESIDMSFGEIASLHTNKELIIDPEYQRLFRWSEEQRSKLIESILLQLPLPQIFVIENRDGVLELIDGLQRISTVLQFMTPESLDLSPLELKGCDIIKELNGHKFQDLPLVLRLRIKRAAIRMVVIKKQSKGSLQYQMFMRLNTGGSNLAAQEIRNCSARMAGEHGTRFYQFLEEVSRFQAFMECTEELPDGEKERKGREELALRFFALKNSMDTFHGSVRDWLDGYMEDVLLGKKSFDYEEEKRTFKEVFELAKEKLGQTAFLRYKGDRPVGSLPPAYYEAISMGVYHARSKIKSKDAGVLRGAITALVQSDEFRAETGPGANAERKFRRRIELAKRALLSA